MTRFTASMALAGLVLLGGIGDAAAKSRPLTPRFGTPELKVNSDEETLQWLGKLPAFVRGAAGLKAAGTPQSVDQTYATVKFRIAGGDEKKLRKLLMQLEDYLKGKVGSQAGTFTMVAHLKDKYGKLDIKQPIITFQWANKKILFFDKVVNETMAIHQTGWILDEVRLSDEFNTLEASLETYFSKSTSLDVSVFNNIGDLVNASQLASVIPLSNPTLAVIDSIGGIFKTFFDKESKQSSTLTQDVKFIDNGIGNPQTLGFDYAFASTADTVSPSPPPYNPFGSSRGDRGVRTSIRLELFFSTTATRYSHAFDGQKFDQTKLSGSMIQTAMVRFGSTHFGFLEALSQSSKDSDKPLKPLLAALLTSQSIPKQDTKEKDQEYINDQCGHLYASLQRYYSLHDARAMLWSFVTHYGHKFDKGYCLAGNRRQELAAVGLTVD